MHSLRSLLALILFAEATLTTALPADNFELEALSTTTPLLSTRGYDLASSGAPSKGVLCPAQPASRAAPNGYPEFPYSPNQIKAAFIAGAKQAAAEKQIGDQKYPHFFANREDIPFPCGSQNQEFPIQTDGKVFGDETEDVTTTPDRVIFDVGTKGNRMNVNYCGVIRHAPAGFVACPSQ